MQTMTLLAVVGVLVVGCGGEDVCAPGDSKPCTCPGGASGGQVCAGEGTRWEPCVCGAEGEGEGPGNAGIEWVRIPGGRFDMGSENGDDDERPVHAVDVSTFELARTEVTVAQYRACVDAGRCEAPDTGHDYCNWGVAGRDDHPVNCVDWNQARAFAAFVGGRLPSEAEWEYAARSGGRDQTYPWGDERATCERAVMETDDGLNGCGKDRTWPVCSKLAGNSAQGLCDLAGNVGEWVEDCWHDSYDGAPADGGAWVDDCAGDSRVYRGGSWYYVAQSCRAAFRYWNTPSIRDYYLGFRPARSL